MFQCVVMTTLKCPLCGGKTKRFGKTAAGAQRWQCLECKATFTHKIDNTAKLLKEFLIWLLSRRRQNDMPGGGRTFRRKTSMFWEIWPLPPLVDEIHRVIYVDGIYLARNVVVLIACSDTHVLGWYLARGENTRSWIALLSRIAPPDMVVTDGGSGFTGAVRAVWPHTKVQRCTFHVFSQTKRYTTSRPKLECGRDLYALAKELLKIRDIDKATEWIVSYNDWNTKWSSFLNEFSFIEGKKVYTHERLRKARRSLNKLINQGTLFTYLDPELTKDDSLPAMNNRIEGGVNAQLRHMLQDHRGMNTLRRIKAVFWWCYMHTECPLSPAGILREMPTDKDIDDLYFSCSQAQRLQEGLPGWGDAVVWNEFHHQGSYRMDYD